jgi:hypothetical protein
MFYLEGAMKYLIEWLEVSEKFRLYDKRVQNVKSTQILQFRNTRQKYFLISSWLEMVRILLILSRKKQPQEKTKKQCVCRLDQIQYRFPKIRFQA